MSSNLSYCSVVPVNTFFVTLLCSSLVLLPNTTCFLSCDATALGYCSVRVLCKHATCHLVAGLCPKALKFIFFIFCIPCAVTVDVMLKWNRPISKNPFRKACFNWLLVYFQNSAELFSF